MSTLRVFSCPALLCLSLALGACGGPEPADQGGFFGWMHVGVDPRPARIKAGEPSPDTRDWLVAEVRPLIDGIEVSAPDRLAVGASAAVSATGATSEFGLSFPLRYPASVVWSGGPGLVVARSAGEAERGGDLAKRGLMGFLGRLEQGVEIEIALRRQRRVDCGHHRELACREVLHGLLHQASRWPSSFSSRTAAYFWTSCFDAGSTTHGNSALAAVLRSSSP